MFQGVSDPLVTETVLHGYGLHEQDKGSERLLRIRSVTARCCTDQFSACIECIALGVLAFDLISHRL